MCQCNSLPKISPVNICTRTIQKERTTPAVDVHAFSHSALKAEAHRSLSLRSAYRVSSRTDTAISQKNPVLENQKTKKKLNKFSDDLENFYDGQQRWDYLDVGSILQKYFLPVLTYSHTCCTDRNTLTLDSPTISRLLMGFSYMNSLIQTANIYWMAIMCSSLC